MRSPVVVVQGVERIEEVAGLDALADQIEIRPAASADSLRAALEGANVLLGWDFREAGLRDAWPAARALRWVHWAGAGVDALLFPALVESDVVVTNARGVFDRAMAEYALGLVIAMGKRLPETLRLQSRGEWRHRLTEILRGRRVLIVGVGSIGREIAGVLRAFGLRVSGVGRNARAGDPDFDDVTGNLLAALPGADFVISVAPLTEETAGMFGRRAFAAMKPGARFVNLGRGGLVDEAALVEGLDAGRPAEAALDVFAEEPLPSGHPLWGRDDVIVSPHMSGDYVGHQGNLARGFIENLARFRRGEPLANVVDKRLGYVSPP